LGRGGRFVDVVSVRVTRDGVRPLAYPGAVAEAIAVLSFEEYCAAEGRGDRRHELVGGRVFAMAGGSERHDLLAGLLYEALAGPARTAGCRPFLANRLVRTENGNGYYPDVMVVCGSAAHRLYEMNPTFVAEVLSRSTEDVDRREKAQAYSASTSFQQYVLLDPDHRRIEVARVGEHGLSWVVHGPGDVVDTGYGIVDIDALYDQLDLTATT
jgi:Uma2 family endonuclease